MPLRCLDATGRSIHSFDLTDGEWQDIERENRKARHLRMPCCSSLVTLKRSPRGTPFFAHKAIGACTTAPETEVHLRLKRMAVMVARASGWTAETEVIGTTPTGEQWKADVLAQHGDHKVAVEVQWSKQTNDETLRRQTRYKESGVRGLWLLRHGGFPITRELPAACIGGTHEQGFSALIPSSGQGQSVTMEDFLDAAFSKRLRFGIPLNIGATVFVQGAFAECWHPACQARTRILTRIDVVFGPNKSSFSVSELGEYPDLLRSVLDRLPKNLGVGKIRSRFSKAQGRSYMSNGCIRCDRLQGEFFEIHARNDEETLCTFPIRMSQQWQQAIKSHHDYTETWSVYPLVD